jgi:molecular chaperone DnaK (HSP70)
MYEIEIIGEYSQYNIDDILIDWMSDSFLSENGVDLRKDSMALQRLKEAAEKSKIELSSRDSIFTSVSILLFSWFRLLLIIELKMP